MIETLPFGINDLHAAYAGGVEPAQIIAEVFRRIDALGDPGIFICLAEPDEVLAAAEKLPDFDPACLPLWGIPFAIKDNIDAAGMPTTAGCPAFAYMPQRDAFIVAELKRAGALLIGKTNLDQFATGLAGVRTPYPPPKNAVDPKLVPGGSSAGSAVAVARELVAFSLGTDTAGSGRVPAAVNGIVGLKPTLGAFSNRGVVPACRTLDTVSVFASNVEDAFTVLRTGAVFDPDEAYSKPILVSQKDRTPRLRVAVPDSATRLFFGDGVQARMFEDAIAMLKSFGHIVFELDFTPFYDIAEMLYAGPWIAERYIVIEELLKREPDAIHPTTLKIIRAAEQLSATDVFRGIYQLAELKLAATPLMAMSDVLMVPSIPTFYTVDDLKADPFGPNFRLGTYTHFVNLMDLCGITVPTVPRQDGRPGSVTMLARSGEDHIVAALAREIELGTGDIEIAVLDVHLRGLPLNHELTSRGARFGRVARTAPDYRLYKLAGCQPERSGMIRREGGASIELEIWSITPQALGDLVAGIPAPLSIGTVTLDDGSTVKSFLCEPAGLRGAIEITKFGGWRGYLSARSRALSENSDG